MNSVNVDAFYWLCCAFAGYLIGNIQFAVIISKLKYHDDVRNHGSGNAGSTNMVRTFGLKPGVVTFIGDFAKGICAYLIGRLIAGETGAYIASVAVVLGHCFPAFLKIKRFKGGKGVASTLGILLMLNPVYAAIIVVIGVLLLLATRIIAIVSLVCISAFLLLAVIFSAHNIPLLVCVALLFLIIVIRHIENIGRLIKGEESKLF